MKERFLAILDSIKALWGRLSRVARIVLLTSILFVLVLSIALAVILGRPQYALLNNDFSNSERAEALAVLSEQGVDWQLEPTGAIMVNINDLDRAQMQLATAGLPGGFINENTAPSLTATQADKQYQNKVELQKRLQSIIESNDEVDRAAVTIGLPERNAFALRQDETPPTASIMIVNRPGHSLSPEQIQGILNTVRNSVPGLTEDHISITDESGDLKSTILGASDINNAKLRLTEEVNSTFRSRAMSIVQPMFGPGNVEVAVNSELDTDTGVRESTTYNPLDPENPERNPLDYTQHGRQKTGDPIGVAEGVPGANDNVGTPQYGMQNDADPNTANYSSDDVYDFLVGSTKEQITREGLRITDMTVSVLVNTRAFADGQRDQITALVAGATGVPIENVTVHGYEFAKAEEPPLNPLVGMTPVQMMTIAGIILLGLIILIIIIIVIVTKRKKKEEEEQGLADEDAAQYDENGMPLVDLINQEETFEPITLVESPEQKLRAQIKDLADSDPEIVAQLLKTWLNSTK